MPKSDKPETLNKAYKYRLYPTEKQKVFLEKHFNSVRYIYNTSLNNREVKFKEAVLKHCGKNFSLDFYKKLSKHRQIKFDKGISQKYNRYIKTLSTKDKKKFFDDLQKIFKTVKQLTNDYIKKSKDYKYKLDLKRVSSESLNWALRNLDTAYSNFYFNQAKFPKFKRRNDNKSFQNHNGNKIIFPDLGTSGKFYCNKFSERYKELKKEYQSVKTIKNIEVLSDSQKNFYKGVLKEYKKIYKIAFNELDQEDKDNFQKEIIKKYDIKGSNLNFFSNLTENEKEKFHEGIIGKYKVLDNENGIKCVVHREFDIIKNENDEIIEPKIKTCTVSKTKSGKYYVSVLVDHGVPINPPVKKDMATTVGIDIGLKTHLTLSDPINKKYKISNFTKPGQKEYAHYEKLCKKEKKLERMLARKVSHRKVVQNKKVYRTDNYKNLTPEEKRKKHKELNSRKPTKHEKEVSNTYSKNREKVRLKLAAVREQITNWKKDAWHNRSIELVRRYNTIALEDINLQSFHKKKKNKDNKKDTKDSDRSKKKSFKNSESWRNASLSQFRTFLEYKSKWQGKNLVLIDRFAPSTKTCHHCGHKNKNIGIKDRTWKCPNCSMTHDRDKNAAINIKKWAHDETKLSKKNLDKK
ncbi:hypothetical protein COTS27_00267 [Spirochaetota bacterium]|nr:hypothetical protein COTS27_00267 [Spirochaetota bacterium]